MPSCWCRGGSRSGVKGTTRLFSFTARRVLMLAFGTAPVNACPVYHVIPVAEYTPVPARAALPATQVHPDRPSTKRTRLLASTTGPPSRASTASPRCTKKPPDSGLRVQENALCYYLTRAVAPPIQVADQGEGVVTTPPPSPWLSTRRCSPELLSQPHMHTQACHQLSSYWPLPGPTTGFNRVTPTYEKTSRYGTESAKERAVLLPYARRCTPDTSC